MKKILLIMVVFSTSLIFGTGRLEKRIEKIISPYLSAINFIDNVDLHKHINDHDVFVFFNENKLYKRQDVQKFNNTIQILKNLRRSKKISSIVEIRLTKTIISLEKINQFIIDYAATYTALMSYYQITASYYYIDEHNDNVVDILMQQSEKLGMPKTKGRGLYKFVKKIDLDLRRLTALFTQNNISDELVVNMNLIKKKLLTLRSKIIISAAYKSQLSKTRWLKAFGVLVVPFIILVPMLCAPMLMSQWPTTAYIIKSWSIVFGLGFTLPGIAITVQELQESTKYNIPVHSTSLFSWFAPSFILFTWIPRG